MKVLVISEKLDSKSETYGFFHGRLLDFSKTCSKILVMVLEKKNHTLSKEVKILSLGKEKGVSKITYLINFYTHIFSHIFEYDYVFVHRNPIYIVLGGFIWRLFGKKVTLWYSHTYSDWILHCAVFFASNVISPSQNTFPFKTKKLTVLNGNDLESYSKYIESLK